MITARQNLFLETNISCVKTKCSIYNTNVCFMESFEMFSDLAKKNGLSESKIKAIDNCILDNLEQGNFRKINNGRGLKL